MKMYSILIVVLVQITSQLLLHPNLFAMRTFITEKNIALKPIKNNLIKQTNINFSVFIFFDFTVES